MPEGMLGYGTSVRVGRGATPSWTPISLIGDIDLPDEQVDDVEVTHMASPGRRRQYIAGLIDSGEISIPMNYIPESPTDVMLQEIRASGEEVILEITVPGATEPEQYAAFLKGYGRTAPVDDKMTAEATFRLSGVIEGGS
ncbi:phage tail tube protein [Paracoccus sp. MBLB3053]|uniref:Phage tail tube protein n=1 Tax=Paracoccus aurantius TaxID=3073814 RepID=A0ABU2HUK2_9RHOB|nr:phage tail tube protein [Paracoccus sp. MBLB3053]MDS9468210.1 phage tail tube protein [Paracoccus sp. MBLB3053]